MNLISKIYVGSFDSVFSDVYEKYLSKGSLIVNFLYFANFVRVLRVKNNVDRKYEKALLSSDFVLPDGIALQVFYMISKIFCRVESARYWLDNCNGTDFTLSFLSSLKERNGKFLIHLYGGNDKQLIGAQKFLLDKGFEIGNVKNGYSEWIWDDLENKHDKSYFDVLLVARGTPLQENRIYDNIDQIKEREFMVMGVGGLFGFWSGDEIRAPKLFVILKLEWLWRFIQNPRKNFWKVINSVCLPYYVFYYLLLKK